MRSVIVYAALLTGAMVGAYVTWTADSDAPAAAKDEEVAVYSARSGDVSKLAFDSEKLTVAVERRNDAKGDYIWVTIDETKEKKTLPKPHDHGHDGDDHGEDGDDPKNPHANPDDAPDDAPVEEGPEAPPTEDDDPEPEAEPEVEVEVKHTEFLGSDAATGLFTSFEPLMALRELQGGDSELETFGLANPEAKIVVTQSGGELSIDLGGETYGAKDRYAKHEGKMLLLEDTTVRPLQFAGTRLVERRLHPHVQADLDSVAVKRGTDTVSLVQRNKDDRQAAYWARADNEDSKDDTASTWLDKVMRLKASKYATDVDLTGATETFSVQLTANGETWGFAVLQAPDSDTLYARSEFNRSVVELTASLANEAIADLGELFQD